MAYTIQISETQRQLIMQGLLEVGSSGTKHVNSSFGHDPHYPDAMNELVGLITMVGTLLGEEEKNPGVIHGLSL